MKAAFIKELGEAGPYAVLCRNHGPHLTRVYLTKEQYNSQMNAPNKTWRCPHCREEASWDDDNYEAALGIS